MKKALSVILAVLLLLSVCLLASCGGGGDNGKDTGTDTNKQQDSGSETNPCETEPGDTEPDPGSETSDIERPYLDSIPDDVRFEGGEVHFLSRNNSNFVIEDVDELNEGDAVEVAVYTRQSEVEDRFGITVIGHEVEGTSELNTKWANDVASGSNAYDVMTGHMRFNGSLALSGNNLNINKLKYVDLTQDYWNKSYCDDWCYKKVQFWVTGDIDQDFIGVMVAVYVNGDVFSKYHSDVNLLDIVVSGEWTYVKALELIDGVYEDLNGDNTMNKGDLFGWIFQNGWSVSSLAYSGGFHLSIPDGSKRKVDLVSGDNVAIYNDFYKLVAAPNTVRQSSDDKPLQSGTCMFTHETLDNMTSSSFSEVNFTVIPTPKYSVEEPYRTASYDGVPLIGVESSLEPENYDMIGAFLESYASAGKKYVTEGFFEKGLRGKYSQDEASYKCLGIIRAAGWADFIYAWANHMDDFYAVPDEPALGGQPSITTYAASVVPAAQKKLDTLYTNLSKAAKAAS